MGFLAPHLEKVYAAFRIMMGLLMVQHGAQKILGWFGGFPPEAPSWIKWGAGPIELLGGLLVAIGLAAGPAGFLVSGTMAAAFLLGHIVPSGNIIPIVNKGELAVAYCFAFLLIAAKGSGIWSVDGARK
jgi:putative oxidoreductase